jgi:prepilin-type N-terminal cleavage/methylation domain-containing protein
MKHSQRGFTLIEIAIVLVIIGLLLGGILKGQELITSARVRNLANQVEGIKAAYFGFQDRYRALPGDFNLGNPQIPNVAAGANGDGDGRIEATATINESIAVWDHLSHAGFINGTYTYNAAESPTTTPTNPWGTRMQLIHDATYADTTNNPPVRANLKTGPGVPANILAELDRKMDGGDGATRGSLRYSAYAAGGNALVDADCFDATTGAWLNTEAPCGAAILF